MNRAPFIVLRISFGHDRELQYSLYVRLETTRPSLSRHMLIWLKARIRQLSTCTKTVLIKVMVAGGKNTKTKFRKEEARRREENIPAV